MLRLDPCVPTRVIFSGGHMIYAPRIYHICDICNAQNIPYLRYMRKSDISYIRYIFGTYSHKTIYFFENDIFLKNIPNISYMRYINFQKYIIYTIYFSRSAFGRAKSRYMKYIIYMIYSTLKITLVWVLLLDNRLHQCS